MRSRVLFWNFKVEVSISYPNENFKEAVTHPSWDFRGSICTWNIAFAFFRLYTWYLVIRLDEIILRVKRRELSVIKREHCFAKARERCRGTSKGHWEGVDTEGEGKQDSVGIPSFEWAKYFMKQKLINWFKFCKWANNMNICSFPEAREFLWLRILVLELAVSIHEEISSKIKLCP